MVISGKFIAGGLVLAAISVAAVVGGVKGSNFMDDDSSKNVIASKSKTDVDGYLNLKANTEVVVGSDGTRHSHTSFKYDGWESRSTAGLQISEKNN